MQKLPACPTPVFWPEVIKGVTNPGSVCFVSYDHFFCLSVVFPACVRQCFVSLFLVVSASAVCLQDCLLNDLLLCQVGRQTPLTHALLLFADGFVRRERGCGSFCDHLHLEILLI